jgi:hypothetical protein
MLEAYVATYLKEEIRQEALVKDIASFTRLLRIETILNGQILSFGNVAREAGVARTNVERYFEILVDSLVAVLIPQGNHTQRYERVIDVPQSGRKSML